MNKIIKPLLVTALIIAAASIVLSKKNTASSPSVSPAPTTIPPENSSSPVAKILPKLVDLGAGNCIPCKMMVPILEDLKTAYKNKLEVVFIDVREHPDAAKPYNINLIPTQIFFAPDAKELFRHEGFYSKEDILKKWKELGYDLSKK